jgi:hypothetical protein
LDGAASRASDHRQSAGRNLDAARGTNGVIQESLPATSSWGDNSGLAGLAELRSYTVAQTLSKTAGSMARWCAIIFRPAA